MRTCLVGSLATLLVAASLAGCAGGSKPEAGDSPSDGSEQTTGSGVPDEWVGAGSTTTQSSGPALTADEETIAGDERGQVVTAGRRVEKALDSWDGAVTECGIDTWTSCLSQPRVDLLLALFAVEGLLWRDRGRREGPCRARVRAAYDDVYGFRLSQARADYSDPAPGTAPAGDPDLANLQVAVNQLRYMPAALDALVATVCKR